MVGRHDHDEVGYGDIYPKTSEGRVIAVTLMLAGIGMIGTFTATIASFFMVHEEDTEQKETQQRLDRLEAKLDALLALTQDADRTSMIFPARTSRR